MVLIRMGKTGEKRQADGAGVVPLRLGKIPGLEAEFAVVGLGMNGNVVDVHADAAGAERVEDGATAGLELLQPEADGIEVPRRTAPGGGVRRTIDRQVRESGVVAGDDLFPPADEILQP